MNVHARFRIVEHAGQQERAAPREPVVEHAKLAALEVDAVDHAGLEARHEELAGHRIEGECAETRPAFSLAPLRIVAKGVTSPVVPSIFQIVPGPPPLSRPNCPGAHRASGAPRTRRITCRLSSI